MDKQAIYKDRKKRLISNCAILSIFFAILVTFVLVISWLYNDSFIFNIVITILMSILSLLMVYVIVINLCLNLNLFKYDENDDYDKCIQLLNLYMRVPLVSKQKLNAVIASYYLYKDDLEKYNHHYSLINNPSILKSVGFFQTLVLLKQKDFETAKKTYIEYKNLYINNKSLEVSISLQALRLLFLQIESGEEKSELVNLKNTINLPIFNEAVDDIKGPIRIEYVEPQIANDKDPKNNKYLILSISLIILSILSIVFTLFTMFIIYYNASATNPDVNPLGGSWVGFIYVILPIVSIIYGIIKKAYSKKYKVGANIVFGIVCMIAVLILTATGFTKLDDTSSSLIMVLMLL